MAERDRRRDGFDAGLYRRSFFRSARRKLLAAGLLVAFVEILGVPQIRLSHGDHGKRAAYLGITGVEEAPRNRIGAEPLVRLVPLPRSVISYAREGIERLARRLRRGL